MKSFLKVMIIGSAVALAVALIPSNSFAGERWGGRGDGGLGVLGRVLTAPLVLTADVINHTVPRIGVPGPVGFYPPAPVRYGYGYCAPAVVVRSGYYGPGRYWGGRGYYDRCR